MLRFDRAYALGAIGAMFFVFVTAASAQDVQYEAVLNESAQRDLGPGVAHSYQIKLDRGDYVAGSVVQRGALVNASLFLPNGTHERDFSAAIADRIQFAFAATTPGVYRLVLTSPAHNSRYELHWTQKLSLADRLERARRGQDPTPRPENYSDPDIDALRKQIARGNRSTEAFWEKVSRKGTPLVQPFENDEKYQLVTFLWRGAPETRNVLVTGSFTNASMRQYLMNELELTDVWYLTVKLPRGARFGYGIATVNDVSELDVLSRQAYGNRDPLNPNPWMGQSMAELPGAPLQPWIVQNAATPEGHVENRRFKSARLNNERSMSIYTPPGYKESGAPCDLLVVFDERAYLKQVPAPVILDNLIAASKIPPTVAILVGNVTSESRDAELEPNAPFADFLASELVPWVRAHYNVSRDPKKTVVAGSSLGGIAATYAAFRHSEVFGNVLSQSGSFWWSPDHGPRTTWDSTTETGWLAKQFINSPKLPVTFYLDAGVFEADYRATGGAILEPSRQMRDVLSAKGYTVHYQQFTGGHDYLSWRGTFADGLIALIGTNGGGRN